MNNDPSRTPLAQYDARTLATALRDRLITEKRPELARELESMLVKAGFVDPTPPHPH